MAISHKSRTITLIFTAVLVAVLAVAPSAHAHRAGDELYGAHARHHNRMIKIRAPVPADPTDSQPPANAGIIPTLSNPEQAPSSTADPNASSSTPASSPASTPDASPTSTSRGGLLDGLTSLLGGGGTTTSAANSTSAAPTSTTSTTPSTTSVPTSTTHSTSSAAPTTPPPSSPDDAPTQLPPSQSTRIVLVPGDSSTPSSTPTSDPSSNASKEQHTASIAKKTIVIIVAIAASVGAAFLIWTGIRKWKFKPSSRFEDRMAPIDWQPTNDHDPTSDRISHRRNGSAGSHGSFGSSEMNHGQANLGRSTSGRTIPHDDFPPPHDFTAGPATFAPGPAYSDLQRGSQPQMVESNLARGPSLRQLPDPYGGYSDGYDDGVAPHHGYGGAAHAPQPDLGYGNNQYRGY